MRMSFKPDASFYRKIVIGAVGARAVRDDLRQHGHEPVELERGSTDTKLWKDVKRKRVRVPDLVCTGCGARIECRAKTTAELAMSHSPDDAERSWDYGMVDGDWIAFPICSAIDEEHWGSGRLRDTASYWHERNWVRWQIDGHINYATVGAFRAVQSDPARQKGSVEASERFISWKATFSTRDGDVERITEAADADKVGVSVRRTEDGHLYTWRVPSDWHVLVEEGDQVRLNQILAGRVPTIPAGDLRCPGALPQERLEGLLASPQMTERLAGVKLARIRGDEGPVERIGQITNQPAEDIYVRLEGAVYLVKLGFRPVAELFDPFLANADPQTQLEAVIALGEAATEDATERLSRILRDEDRAFFLRSAASWSLGQIGSRQAQEALVGAFGNVDNDLREEALGNLAALGTNASEVLTEQLKSGPDDVAAGCAEALRQLENLPDTVVEELASELARGEHTETATRWIVWLLGHLPRDSSASAIAELQDSQPELHYAMTVLWSFADSWIARRWELRPGPGA